MKNLVTGCTGFLGQALTARLLKDGCEVIGIARNEGKVVEFKEKFPTVPVVLGDISDKWAVKKAMHNVDRIFHLAATKSVDIAEKQPYNTIKTNIIGTQNIIQESFRTKPSFVLFVSTDKAAQISGVYGCTKYLNERQIQEASEMNERTRYRIVRYGNVWASTGSFITKWIPSIKYGGGIKLTDPEMTRFFWTVEDAIDLIFECLSKATDAKPFVPEMKAMRMGDIVEALKQMYGKFPVEIIGNRGGENLHESMGQKDEKGNIIYSSDVPRYSVEEIKTKFIQPYVESIRNSY